MPNMPTKLDKVLKEAMALPVKDRAVIAERLIASLETKVDPDVDLAWQEEVERRGRDIASGKVKTIPWEVVRARLRKGRSAVG
jgi:putative addiction module component (TIGR02574 family)